jgi:hypothetical protein
MKRYEDWDVRLFEEVEKVKNIPFAYGVHDCALLASHLAYVMTGVDIAGDVRGTYTTAFGALRCLKRVYGVDNLADLVGQYFPAIPVAKASRGDVVLLITRETPSGALGIVLGDKAIFPGPSKCEFVNVSECNQAWRV